MAYHRFTVTNLVLIAVASLLFAARQSAYSQASKEHGIASSNSREDVNVRYARAYLKLARLELQKVQDANAKVASTFPSGVIEPLRAVVRIAQVQLDYALNGDVKSLHKIHLAIVEAKLKAAEDQLKQAVAINLQSPGAVGDSELELLHIRVEVARLALEKAHAVNPRSTIEHLQWQIEELQKEILELNSRVERLSILG